MTSRIHWAWVILIVSSIFGVFHAGAWPLYAAAASDFFPRGAPGSVLGFWAIFYGLGFILAPALGGYLADLTGTFTRSFLMAAVTGALATFFLSRITSRGDL